MLFVFQFLVEAKRQGYERYMECSPRLCQGLRKVLEEAARAGLRYKNLPLHDREEREEAARARLRQRDESCKSGWFLVL